MRCDKINVKIHQTISININKKKNANLADTKYKILIVTIKPHLKS